MPFDFGDVVLVRFPFADQIGIKQRPAIVVSKRTYNDRKPDVIVIAVTSQLRASHGEALIADWQSANLVKPSAIKPVFATLEQHLVVRRLGILSSKDQEAVRTVIHSVIG